MAYKESNPVKVHIVLFIITISVFLLIHVLLALGLLNTLFAIQADDFEYLFPFLMVSYAVGGCLGQFAPFFFIFQYSFLFFRRGVYGEKHSKACIQAFFAGIFGMIGPLFIGFSLIIFIELVDKIYIIIPFLIHLIPVSMMFGAYLFVKDIGGRTKTGIGVTMFSIASMFGAMVETIAIFDPESLSQGTTFFLVLVGMFLALVASAGLVFMILGCVDASRWTSQHKPLIDTQQKQTLEMQQNQIKMQQKQLELQ